MIIPNLIRSSVYSSIKCTGILVLSVRKFESMHLNFLMENKISVYMPISAWVLSGNSKIESSIRTNGLDFNFACIKKEAPLWWKSQTGR